MSNQTTSKHTRNNAKRIPSAIRNYAETNWSLKTTVAVGVITAFFSFGCQEKTNMSGNVNGEARAAKVEKKEVKNPATEIFDGKTMSDTGQGQMAAKKQETKQEQTPTKTETEEVKKTKPDLKKVVPERLEGLPPRGPGPGGDGDDRLERYMPKPKDFKGRS